MDRRGPKVGDAASLWNFTPSPGWTKQESLILKVCLMKFGIGQWIQIQSTGLLPGKLIQQLSGATQRLLGQQSLAAFSSLKVDVDKIRADNEAKTDALRKNGLIIWSGPNPTKEMKLHWQQMAKEQYSLPPEQQQEVDAAFAQLTAAAAAGNPAAGPQSSLPQTIDLLSCDCAQLSMCQKQLLVCHLQQRLLQVLDEAVQQQPNLAHLLTYKQQQQHTSSWIVHGVPTATAAAAGSSNGTSSATKMPAAACAWTGVDGVGAAVSRSLNAAPLQISQIGTAAAAAKASKQGACRGTCTSDKSGSNATRKSNSKLCTKTNGRKRSRSKFDTVAGDEPAGDGEAEFLQWLQRRRMAGGGSRTNQGRRSSSSCVGGSGSGSGSGDSALLAEMMHAALDAGVAQLIEMGYSRSKALDAMRECNCDVGAAVEYLTASCC